MKIITQLTLFEYPCDDSAECYPLNATLRPGIYLLECYGAQGGTGSLNSANEYEGGRGAYARGIISVKQTLNLFLYLGGRGSDGSGVTNTSASGGWNGGGSAGKDTRDNDGSGGGGGATDIRLIEAPKGEESTDLTSLDSRIIVAAGGSGSAYNAYGAPGGDLTGYNVTADTSQDPSVYQPTDTNQFAGNEKGQGGDGKDHESTPGSGAGGGFWGGKGYMGAQSNFEAVSSSGSSYAAGYEGCPEFTHPLGEYFGFKLESPLIKNGFSQFPSLTFDSGKSIETGHKGNGAIRIKPLLVPYSQCRNQKRNLVYILVVMYLNHK